MKSGDCWKGRRRSVESCYKNQICQAYQALGPSIVGALNKLNLLCSNQEEILKPLTRFNFFS